MMDVLGIIVALAIIAATAYYWFASSTSSGRKERGVKPSSSATSSSSQSQSDEPKTKKKKEPNSKKKEAKKPAAAATQKKAAPRGKSHPRYVRRFGGHTGNITAMAVSPNGEWMATAGRDGQIRVAQSKKGSTLFVSTKVESPGTGGVFQDAISALSWMGDNRTVVGALKDSKEVAEYRVRKKKDAASDDKFPYELVELTKKRFATKSKDLDDIDTCLADQAHSNFCLVVTGSRRMEHGNVVVWDGTSGDAVGTLTVPGGIRMSPDGRFLCGRSAGAAAQVKLYEIQRKKRKGSTEHEFEKIASKSVMTLVSSKGAKIADVTFTGGNSADGKIHCDKAVVGCADGTIQIWSLDVEYKHQEDPKLLCSTNVLGKPIIAVAADNNNRIAVITEDDALHVLSYTCTSEPSLSLDISIENTHPEGVADVQFCPSSKFVYTRGTFCKDVFAWNVE